MRISDWSSDVCSSDLAGCIPEGKAFPKLISSFWNCVQQQLRCGDPGSARDNKPRRTEPAQPKLRSTQSRRFPLSTPNPQGRSEEHMSELQSLMRISYAVFCLKKKKKQSKPTKQSSQIQQR